MTKEIALLDIDVEVHYMRNESRRKVENTVGEYSKYQAIAFSDWVQENEYFIPEGYSSYVKRTGQETKFANNQFIKPEVLYDMFITHQSQQK